MGVTMTVVGISVGSWIAAAVIACVVTAPVGVTRIVIAAIVTPRRCIAAIAHVKNADASRCDLAPVVYRNGIRVVVHQIDGHDSIALGAGRFALTVTRRGQEVGGISVVVAG